MAQPRTFQKQIKKLHKNSQICDRVRYKQNGAVEFRKYYYYERGTDEYKFAMRIAEILAANNIAAKELLDERRDRCAMWPKDRYFTCTFEAALVTESETTDDK